MPLINQKIGFVDAVNPDLRAFEAHGGKLLLYAGWATRRSLRKARFSTMKASSAEIRKDQDDFTRLFMVPGIGTATAGQGPFSFGAIGTLERDASRAGRARAKHGNETAVEPEPARCARFHSMRSADGTHPYEGRAHLGVRRSIADPKRDVRAGADPAHRQVWSRATS